MWWEQKKGENVITNKITKFYLIFFLKCQLFKRKTLYSSLPLHSTRLYHLDRLKNVEVWALIINVFSKSKRIWKKKKKQTYYTDEVPILVRNVVEYTQFFRQRLIVYLVESRTDYLLKWIIFLMLTTIARISGGYAWKSTRDTWGLSKDQVEITEYLSIDLYTLPGSKLRQKDVTFLCKHKCYIFEVAANFIWCLWWVMWISWGFSEDCNMCYRAKLKSVRLQECCNL